MQSTSESLLVRLKSPDNSDAWARFVELYTPLIFYWARNTGLQSQDAADLVQEVLTVVFQKLPQFRYDRTKSFRGWLRTVTLNKHREHLRKKKLVVADGSPSLLANLPANGTADSTWDRDYARELVGRAMELMRDHFEPNTWSALQQFLMAQRPAAEIADEMGISVWTIYSAKSRLMARLRAELQGLLD